MGGLPAVGQRVLDPTARDILEASERLGQVDLLWEMMAKRRVAPTKTPGTSYDAPGVPLYQENSVCRAGDLSRRRSAEADPKMC